MPAYILKTSTLVIQWSLAHPSSQIYFGDLPILEVATKAVDVATSTRLGVLAMAQFMIVNLKS